MNLSSKSKVRFLALLKIDGAYRFHVFVWLTILLVSMIIIFFLNQAKQGTNNCRFLESEVTTVWQQCDLPIQFNSNEIEFEVELKFSSWLGNKFRIIPDDCLESLIIEEKEMVTEIGVICNHEDGKVVNLEQFTSPMILKGKIENKGGPGKLVILQERWNLLNYWSWIFASTSFFAVIGFFIAFIMEKPVKRKGQKKKN